MQWYLIAFRKYAVFSGRSRRKEYWMFSLFSFLSFFALAIAIRILFGNDPDSATILVGLYWLAIILPSLGVTVRRLHDTDRSGWWLLIGIIPLIGALVLLIWVCQDSTPGKNQYGSNPKLSTA